MNRLPNSGHSAGEEMEMGNMSRFLDANRMSDADAIRERIIVALDVPSFAEAQALLHHLEGAARFVKIGMELYYGEKPDIIDWLKEKGFRVFLDLKIHDIPNTAQGAMRSLARLGADMITLHAAGGSAMMEAAREGLEEGAARTGHRPLLVAVTQLTSTSRKTMNEEIGIPGTVEETVVRYASLAQKAGLDGVVASPLETAKIKAACGEAFLAVTPGIRPRGSDKGDQTRVTTPEEAFALGADYLVIGRAITRAKDPRRAFEEIVAAVTDNRKTRAGKERANETA
ncbi:orotidine-5'-phosphate decarboxylase [Bacillaceae bacterium]